MHNVIAVSGTRELPEGAEEVVSGWLDAILQVSQPKEIVTGACVGVDALAARIARARGIKVHTIVPSNRRLVDPEWRDHCDTFQEMPEGTTYRHRNIALVDRADMVVVFPLYEELHQQSRRSGTWQTFRIAVKNRKPRLAIPLIPAIERRKKVLAMPPSV